MKELKIFTIFLDIDGVMNSIYFENGFSNQLNLLKLINYLENNGIDEVNIILSTNQRLLISFEDLKLTFLDELQPYINDALNVKEGKLKAIKEHISFFKINKNYLILDDEIRQFSDDLEFCNSNHLYLTDRIKGLTNDDVNYIIEYFFKGLSK